MAVSTINPWSAGAVVFDERPYMAFYQQQMLRKQAKDDALDNYFRDLGKNITSSGMRQQDVNSLLQKNQQWQQNYIQNKDAILHPQKDAGKSYNEYMRGYQDQMGLINESKEAMKSMDEIGKMKLNKDMSYVFDDPNVIDQIQKHELPIGDPNRVGINLATFALPEKPKTVKDYEDLNKYYTGGVPYDKVPGQTENIGNYKTRTPIFQQYSEDNQKAIGQHAMNIYDSDRGWRLEAVKQFNQLIHDPQQLQRLNSVYKPLYGKEIDTPRDAWVAKGILDNNRKATEYKEGEDVYGREVAMEKLRKGDDLWLAQQKAKIPSADTEMNNAWLEGYWKNRISDAKEGKPQGFTDPESGMGIKVGWELKPDQVMLNALTRDGRQPEATYITDKNEIYPVYYEYEKTYDKDTKKETGVQVKKDANGNPVIDKDLSKPMKIEQALVSTGYKTLGKGKAFGRTMAAIVGEGEPKEAPKEKTEKNKQVNVEELRKKYNY